MTARELPVAGTLIGAVMMLAAARLMPRSIELIAIPIAVLSVLAICAGLVVARFSPRTFEMTAALAAGGAIGLAILVHPARIAVPGAMVMMAAIIWQDREWFALVRTLFWTGVGAVLVPVIVFGLVIQPS